MPRRSNFVMYLKNLTLLIIFTLVESSFAESLTTSLPKFDKISYSLSEVKNQVGQAVENQCSKSFDPFKQSVPSFQTAIEKRIDEGHVHLEKGRTDAGLSGTYMNQAKSEIELATSKVNDASFFKMKCESARTNSMESSKKSREVANEMAATEEKVKRLSDNIEKLAERAAFFSVPNKYDPVGMDPIMKTNLHNYASSCKAQLENIKNEQLPKIKEEVQKLYEAANADAQGSDSFASQSATQCANGGAALLEDPKKPVAEVKPPAAAGSGGAAPAASSPAPSAASQPTLGGGQQPPQVQSSGGGNGLLLGTVSAVAGAGIVYGIMKKDKKPSEQSTSAEAVPEKTKEELEKEKIAAAEAGKPVTTAAPMPTQRSLVDSGVALNPYAAARALQAQKEADEEE